MLTGEKSTHSEVHWRAKCLSFCRALQLIQSPALAPLGLVMLKTTSEELACPREDLSVARKEELRKLLLEQVPTVLGLLTGESKRNNNKVTLRVDEHQPIYLRRG